MFLRKNTARKTALSLERTGVVIIGGGPAGVAPLLAAHRRGRLSEILSHGVTLVEQSAAVGEGSIGRWCINSDSTGFSFADCLAGPADSELAGLRNHPITREVFAAGDGTVPLQRAGEFLAVVGQAINDAVTSAPNGHVLKRHTAVSTRRTSEGWLTLVRDASTGGERSIESHHLILATGASQPLERLRRELVAGVNLVNRCGDRLLQSGDVISREGFAAVTRHLSTLGRAPRVVIVGGSTSAAALAHAFLNCMPGVTFGPCGLAIMHRRPLRIYYPSVDAALADNYTEFGPDDICPVSGRVFRLAGFRLDSRELIMRARGDGSDCSRPNRGSLQGSQDCENRRGRRLRLHLCR